MALDYARLAETAARLISENGRAASLVPPSVAADPTQPWAAQTAGTAVAVTAAFLGAQKRDDQGPQPVERRRIETVYVAAEADLPSEVGSGWTLVDGTVRYAVLGLELVKPGSTLIYYVLEVAA